MLSECPVQNFYGKFEKKIAIISEIEKNVAQKKYYNQASTIIGSLKRFLASVPHVIKPNVVQSQRQTDHDYAVVSDGDNDIDE